MLDSSDTRLPGDPAGDRSSNSELCNIGVFLDVNCSKCDDARSEDDMGLSDVCPERGAVVNDAIRLCEFSS
jgi:hypothetical protein